jgi:hypothetical protein
LDKNDPCEVKIVKFIIYSKYSEQFLHICPQFGNELNVPGGLSLMKVTGIPGVKHWPAASHWQTLSYNGRVKQFDLLSFVVHVYKVALH